MTTLRYANKTRAVWRSKTHQGQGFNEFSFEDQSGIEDMFFHAQKDLTTKVLNKSSANIGANRVDNIAKNASLVVGDNAVERVGHNKNVTVGDSGGGLLSTLIPLLQAGGKLFRKSGQKAGLEPVTGMGGHDAGGNELPVEAMTLLGNVGFSQSGYHRNGQLAEAITEWAGKRAPSIAEGAGIAGAVIIVGGSITYYAGLDRMEEIEEILIDRFHSGDMTGAQFREAFGQDLRPEDAKKYWEM